MSLQWGRLCRLTIQINKDAPEALDLSDFHIYFHISQPTTEAPKAAEIYIYNMSKEGDECYVSLAARNIDIWWQSGGIQNPFDTRKHDLSDGFAFFRPQSQATKISDISTTNLEIRNDANTCKIQITPAGEIHFIGTKSVFHHPVEMQKTLDVSGAASMQTTLDVTGKSTLAGGAAVDGIEFGTHKHGGIQRGGGDSDGPK